MTSQHEAVELPPPECVKKITKDQILKSEELQFFPVEFRRFMAQERYLEPTPVQEKCWKAILANQSCTVISSPGSGKTLAFLVPIAYQLMQVKTSTAVVLTPTRELAEQTYNVAQKLRKIFQITTVLICGGVEIAAQIEALHSGFDLAVCTPGRLVEVLFDRHLELSELQIIILDEADRLLIGDLGIQLRGLKEQLTSPDTNPHQLVCAFSATLPESIQDQLGDWVGPHEAKIEVSVNAEIVSRTITQVVHVCAEHKKLQKLKKHLGKIKEQNDNMRSPPRVLIFANTIKTVRFLYSALESDGYRIGMLHGKRSTQERTEAMESFRAGKIQILVATDVAGRGLHLRNLPFVVNYDFPSSVETYIHRIGRTGRLAAYGHAFSFLTRNLAPLSTDLILLLQHHQQYIDPNLVKLQEAFLDAERRLENESTTPQPIFKRMKEIK
eukprot:g3676.t1